MGRNPSFDGARPLWASQNFLTSSRLIRRLLALTSLGSQDEVLEIGPGKGHITGQLLALCRCVTAVELDPALYDRLQTQFADARNLRLIHGDFLLWPLPAHGDYKVFSNLPFGATTDIVRRLAEAGNPPTEAWLVMERGAAMRFCGKPRESLRSVLLKNRFYVRIVYRLQREDFHPMPSVDAVLLHLRQKPAPDVPQERWAHYQRFLTTGFNGGLKGLRRSFPAAAVDRALAAAGVPLCRAPGDILYIQWLCLYRCCCQNVRCP